MQLVDLFISIKSAYKANVVHDCVIANKADVPYYFITLGLNRLISCAIIIRERYVNLKYSASEILTIFLKFHPLNSRHRLMAGFYF